MPEFIIDELMSLNPSQVPKWIRAKYSKSQSNTINSLVEIIPDLKKELFWPLLEWVCDLGEEATPFIPSVFKRIATEDNLEDAKGMLVFVSYFDNINALKTLKKSKGVFRWELNLSVNKAISRLENKLMDLNNISKLDQQFDDITFIQHLIPRLKAQPSPKYADYVNQKANQFTEQALSSFIELWANFHNEETPSKIMIIISFYLDICDQYKAWTKFFSKTNPPISKEIYPNSKLKPEDLNVSFKGLLKFCLLKFKTTQSVPTSWYAFGEAIAEPPNKIQDLCYLLGRIVKIHHVEKILDAFTKILTHHPWEKALTLSLLSGYKTPSSQNALISWLEREKDPKVIKKILVAIEPGNIQDLPAHVYDLFGNNPIGLDEVIIQALLGSKRPQKLQAWIMNLPEDEAIQILKKVGAETQTKFDWAEILKRQDASEHFLEASLEALYRSEPGTQKEVTLNFIHPRTPYLVRYSALKALTTVPGWWRDLFEKINVFDQTFQEETLFSLISLIEKNPNVFAEQSSYATGGWRSIFELNFHRVNEKASRVLGTVDWGQFSNLAEWIQFLNELVPNQIVSKTRSLLNSVRIKIKTLINPTIPERWEDFFAQFDQLNTFLRANWIHTLGRGCQHALFNDLQAYEPIIEWINNRISEFRDHPQVLEDLIYILDQFPPEKRQGILGELSISKFQKVASLARLASEGSLFLRGKVEKILVVDDSKVICKRLGNYLSSLGFEVLSELNSASGIQRYESFKPDAVIADYFLGEETGLTFASQIKERGFKGPLTLISSSRDPAIQQSLNLIDPDALFLSKPFSLRKLLDSIQKQPMHLA